MVATEKIQPGDMRRIILSLRAIRSFIEKGDIECQDENDADIDPSTAHHSIFDESNSAPPHLQYRQAHLMSPTWRQRQCRTFPMTSTKRILAPKKSATWSNGSAGEAPGATYCWYSSVLV